MKSKVKAKLFSLEAFLNKDLKGLFKSIVVGIKPTTIDWVKILLNSASNLESGRPTGVIEGPFDPKMLKVRVVPLKSIVILPLPGELT